LASSAQSGLEIGLPAANARGSNNPAPRSLIQHGTRTPRRRLWIWTFILASVGFVVLAILAVWVIGGLGELGLSGKGVVALTLGFLVTAGPAIGLMALVFFSDRCSRDDGRASAKRERPFP
jgi:hypothetical protein